MGTLSLTVIDTKLEAMRRQDSSWHPCTVSLSSTGDGLVVKFGSKGSEDMLLNKEDALKCLRFRSAPLQGDDCSHVREGEHVLVAHESQSKSLFYDAEVEKVKVVKHLKRGCRCTFIIKWLHRDLEEETYSVPSSSVMRLATKRINDHPTVAAFLKSEKDMGSSGPSPLLPISGDIVVEMDLDKLLEKQVEEISNSVDAYKKGSSEDLLLGIQVVNKGQVQCKPVAASKVRISLFQVPQDQNHLKRTTRSSKKLQVDMKVEDPPPPASFIQEEPSENRCHLSPLASRAALATKKHLAMDGSDIFNSCLSKIMSIEDKLSSEIPAVSVPVVSESVEVVALSSGTPTKDCKNKNKTMEVSNFSVENRNSEVSNSSADNKTSELAQSSASLTGLITERKLSQPTKVARITRSAVQKGTGIPNDEIQVTTCADDMKIEASTNKRRFTRSEVLEKKGARITRFAVQKGTRIPNDDIQAMTGADDMKITASTNKRRFTCSAVLEEKQNLAMEEENKSTCIIASNSSEGNTNTLESNVSKKDILLKKKTAASSPVDAVNNIPVEGSNKKWVSSAVETTHQTEGNGIGRQGQERKSISIKKQERRISPRNFLPRTRSQNQSQPGRNRQASKN